MNASILSARPQARIDTATVPGWGVDANPENDPTYPCRDRSKDDHSGTWVRPTQQQTDVEILQSIEHKQRPAVVGTSTPPSGLSGVLRRAAFRKSESNLLHWMGLLGADRINMIEGVLQDFRRVRIPNVPAEMGMRAEWQYNKRGLALKTAAVIGIIALAAVAIRRRRRTS
jgi:hypothetical protein